MRYLSRGQESKRKIELLLKFTKVRSDEVIGAVIDHLVGNHTVVNAAMINDCDCSSVSVVVKRLNEVAEIMEALFDEKINGS